MTSRIVWILFIFCAGCIVESQPQDPNAVVPLLSRLLKDPSPDVRRTAALSLGKIADSNGVPALIEALKDDDPKVREFSAWALGQIDTGLPDDAVLALMTALGDQFPEVKRAAAASFGQVELQPKRLKFLREVLAISQADTREAVIQALTELDTPLAYDLFVQVIADSDPRVRQAAVAGLGELADRRARPLLRKRLLGDGDEGVRTEAAFRLGKLGGRADIASLKKAVKTDSTPIVHLWAQWALEQIEPPPVN